MDGIFHTFNVQLCVILLSICYSNTPSRIKYELTPGLNTVHDTGKRQKLRVVVTRSPFSIHAKG